MARIAASREADHLYRGFPFHPFHHPPPDGKGFGDRYGNELDLRHLQPDTARRSSVGPSERPGLHDAPFLDSHPFTREGFHGNLPRVERGGGEREWQRRDLAALVNGEYKPAGKDNLPVFHMGTSRFHQSSIQNVTENTKVNACVLFFFCDKCQASTLNPLTSMTDQDRNSPYRIRERSAY